MAAGSGRAPSPRKMQCGAFSGSAIPRGAGRRKANLRRFLAESVVTVDHMIVDRACTVTLQRARREPLSHHVSAGKSRRAGSSGMFSLPTVRRVRRAILGFCRNLWRLCSGHLAGRVQPFSCTVRPSGRWQSNRAASRSRRESRRPKIALYPTSTVGA